jgi:acylphosphatase
LFLNKIDLLPYVAFDVRSASDGVEVLNPALQSFLSRARPGMVDGWPGWPRRRRRARPQVSLTTRPVPRAGGSGAVPRGRLRPFIYNLARRLSLDGWVRNTASGVEIEIRGPAGVLDDFYERLGLELPPLARVDRIDSEPCSALGEPGFRILPSLVDVAGFQLVPADVATCPECLRELFDPGNRRFRYPFTNCTHCGPRLTIIEAMPYDRPATTMSGFEMCPACAAEYQDPADRRFHAQPIACPVCGPTIWLEDASGRVAGSWLSGGADPAGPRRDRCDPRPGRLSPGLRRGGRGGRPAPASPQRPRRQTVRGDVCRPG